MSSAATPEGMRGCARAEPRAEPYPWASTSPVGCCANVRFPFISFGGMPGRVWRAWACVGVRGRASVCVPLLSVLLRVPRLDRRAMAVTTNEPL